MVGGSWKNFEERITESLKCLEETVSKILIIFEEAANKDKHAT